MRTVVCLAVVSLFVLCVGAKGAVEPDAAAQQQVLAQLETKYFGHSFDTDSGDCRTVRLEKLIFGESAAGDLPQRIEKLAAATADGLTEDNTGSQTHHEAQEQTAATHDSNQKRHSDHADNNNSQNLQTASTVPPQFSSDSDSDSGSSGGELYPHIATLEKEILGGQSFPSQPLTERLKRMEVKAFGSASNNPDLSERTDTLEQYVEQKLHKPTFTTESAIKETNLPSSSQPDQEQTDYPHITALEKDILGQTFDDQPPADRLSRMETKAFGKPSKSTDLSQRTDALDKYVEKKLHKKPFEEERSETATTNQQQPQQQSRLPQQILSILGSSLLGSLGGMGGMGFGGLGPGMMPGMFGAPAGGSSGTGFSGTGIRPRNNQSTQQQQQPQQAEEPHEDPVMYAATPPPASARTLVKVGWCEVHVFGHTFPHMHLPERLGQLNIELQFKPGTSDMDLLDDIGPMIKVVQARLAAAPKE